MADQEIIDLFFKRSDDAISVTQKRYGRLIRNIARNICGNEEDAYECENDTYLALWNNIPPDKPVSLMSYACGIVRNIACNRYTYNTRKKRSAMHTALDEMADTLAGKSMEEEWSDRELGQAINAYLGTLSEENRDIFIWRYWYGDSIKDIAKRTHRNVFGETQRLMRIRNGLKKYLEKEGYYE